MKLMVGMTRAEAMHYISTLDVTDRERNTLVEQANCLPAERRYSAPPLSGPYHERNKERLAQLREYMMVQGCATRREIETYFGKAGGDVDYLINSALRNKVIEKVSKNLYRGKE